MKGSGSHKGPNIMGLDLMQVQRLLVGKLVAENDTSFHPGG